MSDDCIFCRIVAGKLPAHRLYEDDLCLAFLDLHPIRAGHTLIIPKKHHVWFEDIPPATSARIMALGQQFARAMKGEWGVERVSFFYTGIHVPHAHAHIVPMHHPHDVSSAAYLKDGIDGFSLPPSPDDSELTKVATRLRQRL
ncbi:HIT family protein [Phaeovulum sp.]|uniref:HIT family protein n=1 Tax=Phaeovulum sp. TaxID=2934796 RepID=UPI0039E71A50